MKRLATTLITLAVLAACGKAKTTTTGTTDSLIPTPLGDVATVPQVPETVFVTAVPPPAPRRAPRPTPPPPPPAAGNAQQPPAPPRGRGILESETHIKTTLIDSIHSRWSGPGDPVMATVAEDMVDNGRVVIPAGSVVTFRITAIGPATSRGERGTLGLDAESVRINGRNFPMSGTATEYDFELKGRHVNAGDVATAAGGAAIGAIIGRVIGGKTGTIIGAVGGGAAGTAVAAKNVDRDIIVHAGASVTIVLLAPFER